MAGRPTLAALWSVGSLTPLSLASVAYLEGPRGQAVQDKSARHTVSVKGWRLPLWNEQPHARESQARPSSRWDALPVANVHVSVDDGAPHGRREKTTVDGRCDTRPSLEIRAFRTSQWPVVCVINGTPTATEAWCLPMSQEPRAKPLGLGGVIGKQKGSTARHMQPALLVAREDSQGVVPHAA